MNMRGNTGGNITFGIRVLIAKSIEQKTSLRRSNKSEVIGNSNYLP